MIIISVVAGQPQRVQRVFERLTRIMIQVRGPQIITLARDQGEASNPNDGIQLTSANTSPPFTDWWLGEMWFTSTVAGQSGGFNLEIIGEANA